MATLGLTSQKELAALLVKTNKIKNELVLVKSKLNALKSSQEHRVENEGDAIWENQKRLVDEIDSRISFCNRILKSKLGLDSQTYSDIGVRGTDTSTEDILDHLLHPAVQSRVVDLVLNEIKDISWVAKAKIFQSAESVSTHC